MRKHNSLEALQHLLDVWVLWLCCAEVFWAYFRFFFFQLLFLKWEFWLPSHPKFHYSAGSFVSAHSFSLCFGTGGFYFSKWCHIPFFKLPYICHASCRQVGSAASFIPHFHQPKLKHIPHYSTKYREQQLQVSASLLWQAGRLLLCAGAHRWAQGLLSDPTTMGGITSCSHIWGRQEYSGLTPDFQVLSSWQ